MAVRLVLLAAAVLNKRRRARTETLRAGLWVCFVTVLYWAVFGGRIFAHPATDALFKAWLLVFLLVNTLQICSPSGARGSLTSHTRRHSSLQTWGTGATAKGRASPIIEVSSRGGVSRRRWS